MKKKSNFFDLEPPLDYRLKFAKCSTFCANVEEHKPFLFIRMIIFSPLAALFFFFKGMLIKKKG